MSDELLTVAALRTTVEAELIRSKLEKAGITAVLLEPQQPADGTPAGRVQVQVSPSDFERAMQLLFPIPQRPRPVKTDAPNWKCPKCGEQVISQFPVCWKCGTTRQGTPAPSVSLPSAAAGANAPPSTPPSVSMAPSLSTAGPAPPAPPVPPDPDRFAAGPAAPRAAPRISLPGAPATPLEIPPIPPMPGTEPVRPATNGESPSKPALVSAARTRTAEEEGLNIVVPAWDAATVGQGRTRNQKSPTDADDRAARRAWWTAVFGIVCPPLLLYSVGVVLLLGLTGRELSRRGTRFFYGALAVNALIIGAAFVWLGIHR